MNNGLSKDSITKLCRVAGIKIISEDSYDVIRDIYDVKLREICKNISLVNDINGTNTIMIKDLYEAFELSGEHVSNIDFNVLKKYENEGKKIKQKKEKEKEKENEKEKDNI